MKQCRKQRHSLRVLVMSQQNKLDRVLMMNLHHWGYDVLRVPSVSAVALQESKTRDTTGRKLQMCDGGIQKGMVPLCVDEEHEVEGDVLLYDVDESFHDLVVEEMRWYALQSMHEPERRLLPKAQLSIVFSSRSVARTTLEYLKAIAVLQKPFEMGRLHRYLRVLERLLYPSAAETIVPSSYTPHERTRVLVVDDDVDVAAAIRQCLIYEAENKYDVVVAHDGLDALEKCLDWKPQCIVTDVIMPWMNGYQVMRCLAAGALSVMPAFVIISALTHFEVPINRTYLTDKAVAYVNKPFLIDHLLTAVEQVCTK